MSSSNLTRSLTLDGVWVRIDGCMGIRNWIEDGKRD